jgi:tRNA(Ile2) C34 agmatinyltransferase TiaS
MSDLPGYDDWKLDTPPEYDAPECPKCGSQNYSKDRDSSECPDCDLDYRSPLGFGGAA